MSSCVQPELTIQNGKVLITWGMPTTVPDYLIFTPVTRTPTVTIRGRRAFFLGQDGIFKHVGNNGVVEEFGAGGDPPSVTVGTVTTLSPGSPATVTNAGTEENVVLNFGIPAGAGGSQGLAATIEVGTVTTGETPSVTNVGTDTAAVFDFVFPEGGGTGPVRGNAAVTTSSIANNATWTGTWTIGKTAIPNRISSTHAAWVRAYQNEAYLIADASRPMDVDATGESGLVLEFVLDASNLTWDMSPQFSIMSVEDSADYAVSVKNLSGSSAAITVTLNRLLIET